MTDPDGTPSECGNCGRHPNVLIADRLAEDVVAYACRDCSGMVLQKGPHLVDYPLEADA